MELELMVDGAGLRDKGCGLESPRSGQIADARRGISAFKMALRYFAE